MEEFSSLSTNLLNHMVLLSLTLILTQLMINLYTCGIHHRFSTKNRIQALTLLPPIPPKKWENGWKRWDLSPSIPTHIYIYIYIYIIIQQINQREKLGTLGGVPEIHTNIYHIYGLYNGCIVKIWCNILRTTAVGYSPNNTHIFPLNQQ